MAGSRLHKLGSIYERVTGLLETGALREYEKPIWYDVYYQHPPKYEPRFDRKAPEMKVTPIFYEEDLIRAEIHKVTRIKYFDLEAKRSSRTQLWIKKCQEIMKEKGVSVNEAIKFLDITNEQREEKSLEEPKNVAV